MKNVGIHTVAQTGEEWRVQAVCLQNCNEGEILSPELQGFSFAIRNNGIDGFPHDEEVE